MKNDANKIIMKLCIVIQSLDIGGSSQVVYDLINNLHDCEFIDLSLIVFFDNVDQKYANLFNLKNVKIYLLHKKRTIDIPFMFRLKKVLKLINPNIISTHLTCVAYLNFFVNYKKCKVFHTIHNTPSSDLPKIYRLLIKRNVKKGNIKLICCHEHLVPSTEKLYKVKALHVNNGIKLSDKLVEKKKIYDLLIIGRMTNVKRFDLFVTLVKKLKDMGVTIRGAMCGYGPDKDNVLKLRDEFSLVNDIDYFDNTYDVTKLYETSNIFVSCSSREGAPIVMLEANSYGLPIIATKVGGVPSMISDGVNGYLYEYGDLDHAFEIILSLLKDANKLKELKKSALLESKKHSDKIMAQKYLDIFLEAWKK